MIVITGASSGIGAATAKAFAAQRQPLILLARRKDRIDDLAAQLTQAYGNEVVALELDVSDKDAVARLVQEHAALFSRAEVLVNNAGLAKGFSPIQDGNVDDWDVMIDTNLKGLLYITRALLPGMIERGVGHIVNIGSVAGYWAYGKGNVYSATKFAVRSLTESLRLDLLGTPIRVTEIDPGMVETEFSEVRFNDKQRAKEVYAGMQPLSGEDIAEAIVWSVNRPKHVNIQQLVIFPTAQAAITTIARKV